jgi:hypothetical protein
MTLMEVFGSKTKQALKLFVLSAALAASAIAAQTAK